MRLVESFGVRNCYCNERHVAFIIFTLYKRRGGVYLDIFVESTIDEKGICNIMLREDGTNNYLNIEHINKYDLYELIIKELNKETWYN